MLSSDTPERIGTNSRSVIEISPIMMYRAYCVTTPVSSRAIVWLPPYSELVNPNGPSSSIAPRSSTLDVIPPSAKALPIT